MKDFKGCGKKQSWPIRNTVTHFPEDIEKKTKICLN